MTDYLLVVVLTCRRAFHMLRSPQMNIESLRILFPELARVDDCILERAVVEGLISLIVPKSSGLSYLQDYHSAIRTLSRPTELRPKGVFRG